MPTAAAATDGQTSLLFPVGMGNDSRRGGSQEPPLHTSGLRGNPSHLFLQTNAIHLPLVGRSRSEATRVGAYNVNPPPEMLSPAASAGSAFRPPHKGEVI